MRAVCKVTEVYEGGVQSGQLCLSVPNSSNPAVLQGNRSTGTSHTQHSVMHAANGSINPTLDVLCPHLS